MVDWIFGCVPDASDEMAYKQPLANKTHHACATFDSICIVLTITSPVLVLVVSVVIAR